jgi:hypothetical protein
MLVKVRSTVEKMLCATNRWFLLLLLVPVFSVAAPPLPSCNVERTAKIHFSSATSPDILRVAVKGNPCWAGMASISITTSKGRILYRRDQRFKSLNPVQWDDPSQPVLAKEFVDYTIEKGIIGNSSGLPPWTGNAEDFYDNNSTSVAIDVDRYEALRKLKMPVFYHQTYYEGGIHLVYDTKQKAAVIVLEGGL